MKRTILAAVFGGILMLGASPAFAQEIDRVTGFGPTPGGRAPEGLKVVSPGALLFASFDRNLDGRVTVEEITAGAAIAFAIADKNKDGFITGFEQSDWASMVGDGADILANAMTFDINLDRNVTEAEFLTGLKRIAAQISSSHGGDLAYADLLKPLTRPDEQAGNAGGGGFGTLTPVIRGTAPGGGQTNGQSNGSGGR